MPSKHKDKDKDRDDDEKERERSRSKRSRSKEKRHRSRSRDRDRRDREKDRDRRRSKSRERKRRSRSRDRRRSRSREHRRRSRSRDRYRRSRSRDSRRRSKSRSRRSRSSDRKSDKPRIPIPDATMLLQHSQQLMAAQALAIQQQLQQLNQPQQSLLHQTPLIQASSAQNAALSAAVNASLASSKPDFLIDAFSNANQSMATSRNFTNLLESIPGEVRPAHTENSQNSNSCDASNSQDGSAGGVRKRKKKSRWAGNESEKTFIPGMPTVLPAGMTPDQQQAYLVQLQIEEISRKLRTGDLGIAQNPEERSPSPEPIYSSDGKRLNTREFRTRKRLEEQRHQLILRMQCMNPEFKPPSDYKPPVIRVSDKVLIPQEEHPDINFVGLLIGPRGNTLKAMEKETGAKIIIRGKGSVKEGKVGRKDGQPLPGEDEPLHAFITASNPECVKKAVDKIKEVIRQGIEVPEGHNDLRRMQLRELAQLNGTLRESDVPRCNNCGSTEHKSWVCPERQNVTNNIVCTACGGVGHIAKDCRSKRPGMGGAVAADSQAKIDEEYMSLMAELGEGPDPAAAAPGTGDATKNNMPVIPNIPRNNFSNLFESKPAPRPIMPAPTEQRPPPGPPLPPQPPNVWPSAPPPPIPSLMSNPPIPGINGAPLNPILANSPPTYPTSANSWNQQPCPPGEGQPEIPGVMPPGTSSWNPNPPPMPPNFPQNNSFNCFPPIPNLTLPPPPPPPS
uniref:Branchpoint-bridging protein n=1 Tax=Culicoides sonorensis TaxID=179676 RepID=A0A336LHZ0_CULSO